MNASAKKSPIRLGVVMDPIASISFKKDSTLAMLLEAQRREWEIHYFETKDLYLKDGKAFGTGKGLRVFDDPKHFYEWKTTESRPTALGELDVILMRKDPPFSMDYVYTTYILERAEKEGALVVNKPSSLRLVNEKVYTAWFPECVPPTLVSKDKAMLRSFVKENKSVILKPLDSMGGTSIFRVDESDLNANVIIDTITKRGTEFVMAQSYIKDVTDKGDKRILLIDGDPIPYSLVRHPAKGDFRGNLAAGASSTGEELNDRDRWICNQIGPTCKALGLIFVGIDVIGDYLTEINVTSPTCIRELDQLYKLNIAGELMTAIEKRRNPESSSDL